MSCMSSSRRFDNQLYWLWLACKRTIDFRGFASPAGKGVPRDAETLTLFTAFLSSAVGVMGLLGLGIFWVLNAVHLRWLGTFVFTTVTLFPLAGIPVTRWGVRRKTVSRRGKKARSIFFGSNTAVFFAPLSAMCWGASLFGGVLVALFAA
jgi:hypothetical protein